jgi:plasmid stability protein
MINHMKIRTTLILPDQLMRELKRRAAARGETLSAVVEEALRKGLAPVERSADLTPLPTHRMGRPKVDVADRDALQRAMEER